jgi:hypothetical protein
MATTYLSTTPLVAPTVYKNSGVLRYTFSNGNANGDVNAPPLAAAIANGDSRIAYCLGAPSLVTPDNDSQAFGETVGHAEITPAFDTPFATLPGGGVVAQQNAEPIGDGAGIIYPPTGATHQRRIHANGRIPAGTKVLAWFQKIFDPAAEPSVMTEIRQNRVFRNGVEDPLGDTFISSIRVSISNLSSVQSLLEGTLFVWLMSSVLDIPGSQVQDQARWLSQV